MRRRRQTEGEQDAMEMREEFFGADVEGELEVDEGGELLDEHRLLRHAQHPRDAHLTHTKPHQPAYQSPTPRPASTSKAK